MLDIKTVPGLVGSGKSYQMVQYIKESSSLRSYVIALPTHKLSAQWEQLLKQNKVFQTVVRIEPDKSHNPAYYVKGSSITAQFLQQSSEVSLGLIIIVTHSALKQIVQTIDYSAGNWTLIIDEVISNTLIKRFNIPESILQISPYIEAIEVPGKENISELYVKNTKAVLDFLKQTPDASRDSLVVLLKHLVQGDKVRVVSSTWKRLVDEKRVVSIDKATNILVNLETQQKIATDNVLDTFIVTNPKVFDKFKNIYLLGAFLQNNQEVYLWKNAYKVNFIEQIDIVSKLRFTKHNTSKLRLFYVNESRASVNLAVNGRESIHKKGKYYSALECKDMVHTMFGNDFIYTINSALTDKDTDAGERISIISHGLNEYQNYNTLFLGAIMNADKSILAFYESYGLSQDKARKMLNQPKNYQCLGRLGGIRDWGQIGKVPLNVICVDKASALEIAEMMPGCTIQRIKPDGTLSAPLKTVLKKAPKRKTREELVTAKEGMAEALYHKATTDSTVIRIKDDSESTEVVWNSVNEFKDIYCKKPINTLNQQVSSFKFMKLLRDCVHINKVKSKGDNTAFMGNHLKEVNGILGRKKENVVYTTMLVLDVDDGDIDIKDMKAYFHKRRLASVLYTSWNASVDKPNRYRVVVMADRAMNQDEHEAIYRYLIEDINSWFKCYTPTCVAGKERVLKDNPDALFSGIDTSKINLSSMFYLPAQNPEHRDTYQVYLNYGQNSICVNKNLLKVDAYLLSSGYLSEEDESVELVNLSGNTQPIFNGSDDVLFSKEEMLAELDKGGVYLGNHLDFGRAVCALKHGGCTVDEIEPILSKISRSKTRKDLEYAYKSFNRVPFSWICRVVSLACLNAI